LFLPPTQAGAATSGPATDTKLHGKAQATDTKLCGEAPAHTITIITTKLLYFQVDGSKLIGSSTNLPNGNYANVSN
jgi:hypothetical protein